MTGCAARSADPRALTANSPGAISPEAVAGSTRSFARTGTQLLGGEYQRLDGALGPGEDDSTFGGVHQQRRAAGSFVRSQPGPPEKGCERIARGVERFLRPF